jgi:hypothetical protein
MEKENKVVMTDENETKNESQILVLSSDQNTINPKSDKDDCEAKESSCTATTENTDSKFFFTEVMTTAGPRKNFLEDAREGDYDLGEDVVGCIVKKDIAIFWVLDGTSDSPIFLTTDKREVISSRLLSQDIGWMLQRIIWDKRNSINPEEALRECFYSIVEDWQNKLNSLNDTDKERLFEILSQKTSITVSSTAIFGTISIDGNLNVSQIGDSFIVTNPTINTPNLRGRFFLVIKANVEEKVFTVESNPFEDTRCNTIILDNVQTIVVGTDGVSQNTQKWLQLKPADFTDPVFRKTISAIKHGTCDDKALCVIQILNDDRYNN